MGLNFEILANHKDNLVKQIPSLAVGHGDRAAFGQKLDEAPHDKTNKMVCAPSEDSD